MYYTISTASSITDAVVAGVIIAASSSIGAKVERSTGSAGTAGSGAAAVTGSLVGGKDYPASLILSFLSALPPAGGKWADLCALVAEGALDPLRSSSSSSKITLPPGGAASSSSETAIPLQMGRPFLSILNGWAANWIRSRWATGARVSSFTGTPGNIPLGILLCGLIYIN